MTIVKCKTDVMISVIQDERCRSLATGVLESLEVASGCETY